VWLSVSTASAAPPGLEGLPDPADLPDVDPTSAKAEPSDRGRPAATRAGDGDGDPIDSDADADEDESKVVIEDEQPDKASKKPASKPAPSKPAKPKSAVKKLSKPQWIKHEVIPGERLDDIATRYDVRPASLIRWNKLDPDKPRIYAGRTLAVYTKHIPPPQQKLIYTVKSGDTWAKIANAHRVDADHLRSRWNPKVPRAFKAGQELIIWIDPMTDPDLLAPAAELTKASAGTSSGTRAAAGVAVAGTQAVAALPLMAIPKGAVSVGKPNKGKLINSAALPENKPLYTIRRPDECYGSSHALYNLQLAIAEWRQATGFAGSLLIGAISKKGGGRLRPHSSHQSGRDVDIRLPVKRSDGSSDNVDDVDWDATWALILALVSTGEVEYIFLTTDRQKHLLKAAKRAGASKDLIERMLQYPETSGNKNGIVRNQKGHTAHIHVRFRCAANETGCETY
jgi:murein endopeptidase/LysM repeat protein